MIDYNRWDEVKEVQKAWWARENEKAVIRSWAGKKRPDGVSDEDWFGVTPSADESLSAEEAVIREWTDPLVVVPRAEAAMGRTYYAGGAFPETWPNLGPSLASAYLGCPLIFGDGTSWQEPIVEDWDTFLAGLDGLMKISDGHVTFTHPMGQKWWQATLDLTRAMAESAQGRYIVGISDIGGSFDIISHLRYPTRLCEDFADDPTPLPIIRDWVTKMWFALFNELQGIIGKHQVGSTGWIGIWGPGTCYPLQCDFSCMISPRMYSEIVLPEVIDYAKGLDNTIYHLDGPGAAGHLDALLSIPELDAVQWVPGSGAPTAIHWMPMLKKIQAAGKGVQLWSPADEIPGLLAELKPQGLMIDVGARTPEEADALVALAGK